MDNSWTGAGNTQDNLGVRCSITKRGSAQKPLAMGACQRGKGQWEELPITKAGTHNMFNKMK